MKKIAIASGKGGTGKTTVSVNLFNYITNYTAHNVLLVDCDVEEPNSKIFLDNPTLTHQQIAKVKVPVVNENNCTYCKKCAEYCTYNAITVIASKTHISINTNLCHSCGACTFACNYGAISEKDMPIGTISFYNWRRSVFTEGRLTIGSSMQTSLIKKLKASLPNAQDITLYDAPPGTSCSVVETIHDANYVILVAEPTPFGIHDLSLMVELVRNMNLSFGIVINKAGIGNNEIYDYIEKEKLEIIGELPFSKAFAQDYSSGNMIQELSDEWINRYAQIVENSIKKSQKKV